MIIAEWKPMEELLEMLAGKKKLLLVGCATCVAECAAGGEREVETLAPLLAMARAARGEPLEVVTRTIERQCEWEFIEPLKDAVAGVDVIMSLACGIGCQALAERFADLPVLPGVNTTALAIREQPGVWAARCAACGDCALDETFGFCPIARCAKSLQNGPCGGTREGGKCEIDAETDCVWYLIWQRARERGAVDTLLRVRKCRSWGNSRHGGPKRVVREDLRP